MEVRLLLRNGEQLLLAVVIPVLVLVAGVVGAERVGLDLAHRAGRRADARACSRWPSCRRRSRRWRSRPGSSAGTASSSGWAPLRCRARGCWRRRCWPLLVVEVLQLVVLTGRRARARLVAVTGRRRPGRVPAGRGARAPRRSSPSGCCSPARCARRRRWPPPTSSTCCSWPAGPWCCRARRTASFGDVARWLPSGALGDAVRAGLPRRRDRLVARWLCLLAWAAVGGFLTSRTFRWE